MCPRLPARHKAPQKHHGPAGSEPPALLTQRQGHSCLLRAPAGCCPQLGGPAAGTGRATHGGGRQPAPRELPQPTPRRIRSVLNQEWHGASGGAARNLQRPSNEKHPKITLKITLKSEPAKHPSSPEKGCPRSIPPAGISACSGHRRTPKEVLQGGGQGWGRAAAGGAGPARPAGQSKDVTGRGEGVLGPSDPTHHTSSVAAVRGGGRRP